MFPDHQGLPACLLPTMPICRGRWASLDCKCQTWRDGTPWGNDSSLCILYMYCITLTWPWGGKKLTANKEWSYSWQYTVTTKNNTNVQKNTESNTNKWKKISRNCLKHLFMRAIIQWTEVSSFITGALLPFSPCFPWQVWQLPQSRWWQCTPVLCWADV